MSKITWKSKRILTENGMVNGYITIEDGYIRDICDHCDGAYQDAGELGIYPGIIDIHNRSLRGRGCAGLRQSFGLGRGYRNSAHR